MSAEKVNFSGNYSLSKNENFDGFLKANGVNWVLRQMINRTTPSMKVHQDGDNFEFITATVGMTHVSRFTVGVEVDEKQESGDVMKCLVRWEGDKLVMTLDPVVPGKGLSWIYTRELNGDELIWTMQVKDVVGRRIFKKTK